MIFCSVDTELLIIFTDTNDMSNEFTYCAMVSLLMISYTFCTHKDKTENYICFAHSLHISIPSHPLIGLSVQNHSMVVWNWPRQTKADHSGWKWMKMDKNGWKGMKMDENGWKLMKMNKHGRKWTKMDENGWKWMKMDEGE